MTLDGTTRGPSRSKANGVSAGVDSASALAGLAEVVRHLGSSQTDRSEVIGALIDAVDELAGSQQEILARLDALDARTAVPGAKAGHRARARRTA